MATINIANLTFTHKGNYDGSTAYVKNDVVYYATNGNAYIAKQGTTGNVPTNGTYWSQFAAGSGGIWNAGLSLGSASQSLRVNSGANALEFYTPSAGGILQLKHNHITGTQSIGNGTSTASGIDITNSEISLTRSSASNKIFICTSLQLSGANDLSCKIMRKIGSGSYANILLNSQRGSETLAHVSNTNRDNHEMSPNNIQLLDAPNTTSQVYYKAVAFNGPEGGGGGYVNRPGATSTSLNQETVISTITIMEIASGIL
jgi:hypothetical protein